MTKPKRKRINIIKMENKTTDELRDILNNPAKAQQHAAALAELLHPIRRSEDGGIRPTRPNL